MAKKSKKRGSIALIATFLSMCALMILAFFVPAYTFSGSVMGISNSETYSMLQVLQTFNEGNIYIAAVLSLVVTVLAGIMIITGLLRYFTRSRALFFLNIIITIVALLTLSVASGYTFAVTLSDGLGALLNVSITIHMSIFFYIIGAVVTTITSTQRRF